MIAKARYRKADTLEIANSEDEAFFTSKGEVLMSKQHEKTAFDGKLRPLTISDIAGMANVGVATVSRVLNSSPKVSPKTTALCENP